MEVNLTPAAHQLLLQATEALAKLGLTPEEVGQLARAAEIVDCANNWLGDASIWTVMDAYTENGEDKWRDLFADCLVYVSTGEAE
jgi:hypothetical protein